MTSTAQEYPEYRMEIGAGAGMVSYLGDFNGNLLKNMQPAFSLTGKYRYNPRMALGLSIGYGKLKGTSTATKTYYPTVTQPVNFSHQLIDANLRFEYNFWAYGTGREYRGAKRIVPFIGMGLGVTYVDAKPKSAFAGNLSLGGGIKYKVADRWNLTGEWMAHFTGSDKLDGVEDPYGIKSGGLFKNTDCYSELRLSITYDIWAKCKTCNNDRE